MATNSAGVNFGKPNEEFIIESDGNGALTSARNAVTGEEFVGAGGTYSTAHVTFEFTDVGNGQPVIVYGLNQIWFIQPFTPNNEFDQISGELRKINTPPSTSTTIEVPFIPGTDFKIQILGLGGSTDIGGEFYFDHETPVITVSGNAEILNLETAEILISGDCTIRANTIYD